MLYEKDLFLFLLWKELLFIYTTGCMFLFCKKEILLLLFVQLRKSPGKSLNFVAGKSETSPGSVFWVGTMPL